MFGLDTWADLVLYISSHLIFYEKAVLKKLFKRQSLKRERVKKALLWKLVRLGKGGAKMYSKCMMPKPKAYSSKKYQKIHGIIAQKLSCIDQRVWKMEAK